MLRKLLFITSLLLLLCSCQESKTQLVEDPEQENIRALLALPDHMPLPYIPKYNPLTKEKISLGRRLFYDKKLSANQTQSCGSCHFQALAFSDGKVTPTGSTGQLLARNSQGLSNVLYHTTFTWANNTLPDIEDQLQIPIRADAPVELGVTDQYIDEVLARFSTDPVYQTMFAAAFPEDGAVTMNKIVFSIASFVRTMISANSPYDQFIAGNDYAITPAAKRGLALFNGEKFECFHCHRGINFSNSYRDINTDPVAISFEFFNVGLYDTDSTGSYPRIDQGLYEVGFNPDHRGMYRPPTLRNVELTGPYMHDGSITNLRDVIKHYSDGGRNVTTGRYVGDGRYSPLKSALVQPFSASEQEIDDLIEFLNSLTDQDFITNPKFSNPHQEP
ncbi:MAG: di-heme enzyme [Gammaproteobacteria bacterium]|nr:di-heme enzyme [Gammaproteobacteria bacterium]